MARVAPAKLFSSTPAVVPGAAPASLPEGMYIDRYDIVIVHELVTDPVFLSPRGEMNALDF